MSNQLWKFIKRCTNQACDNTRTYPVRKGVDALNANHAEPCPDCGYDMTAMMRVDDIYGDEMSDCEY